MSKSELISREEASKRIDAYIAEHDDWRGEMMAWIRKIIHEVCPDVVEDWKYMGSPFWSHQGMGWRLGAANSITIRARV
jgi:hypothetical protein